MWVGGLTGRCRAPTPEKFIPETWSWQQDCHISSGVCVTSSSLGFCFIVFLFFSVCVSPFVLPTSVPSCVPSPVSTCLSPSASCHRNYLLLPPCALLLFLLSVGSRPMEVLSNGRPTHPQEENVLRKTWFQTRLIPGITALNVIAVSRSWRRSFKDKGCWNLASLYFREEFEKKTDLFWVSEGESRCSWVILFFYLFNRIIPFFLVSSLQKCFTQKVIFY